MKIYIFCWIALAAIAGYIGANFHQRHYYDEDHNLRKAWNIYLPGYDSYVNCGGEIDLSMWVGTQRANLIVVNAASGDTNAEATAGEALLSIGLYRGFELKEKDDGHYVLFKEDEIVKYWSWSTPYRLTKGEIVDDG